MARLACFAGIDKNRPKHGLDLSYVETTNQFHEHDSVHLCLLRVFTGKG